MSPERLYEAYLRSRTVTTDSRAITPGCLFFAFKGERFDGNAFAPQALEQGAALCVISDPQYKVDDRCIVVPDVLETLRGEDAGTPEYEAQRSIFASEFVAERRRIYNNMVYTKDYRKRVKE